MTFSLDRLVVFNVDAALEPDDDGDRSVPEYDDGEESYSYQQQPRRSNHNMPPASSGPCHRLSFCLAVMAAISVLFLAMGYAGKYGKSLRATAVGAPGGGNPVAPAVATASTMSEVPLVSLVPLAGSPDGNDEEEGRTQHVPVPAPPKTAKGGAAADNSGGSAQKDEVVGAAIATLFGPTPEPTTARPTPRPTPRPTLPLRPTYCRDDPTYRSKVGMVCSQHITLKCRAFVHIGVMNQREVDELLRRCPVSCHVAECEPGGNGVENDGGGGPRPVPAPVPANPATAWPTTPRPTRKPTRKPTMPPVAPPEPAGGTTTTATRTNADADADEQQYECPYGTDDKLYRSPLGQPCEYFREVNCHMLLAIGFHITEVADVINACPCACEVPYGAVKLDLQVNAQTKWKLPEVQSVSRPAPVGGGKLRSMPTPTPTTASPTTAPPTPAPTARPTARPSSSFPTPKVTGDTNQFISPPLLILGIEEQVQNNAQAEGGDGSRSSIDGVTIAALLVLSVCVALGIWCLVRRRRRVAKLRKCLSGDESSNGDDSSNKNGALEESYEDDSIVVVEEEEKKEYESGRGGEDASELRSCFRDRSTSMERGHRRSVSWGKARVRRIQRIQSESAEDSFEEENPPQEEAAATGPPLPPPVETSRPTSPIQMVKEDVLSPQWPSKNDLRWYNLGLLKALGDDAMGQMGRGKDAILSGFQPEL